MLPEALYSDAQRTIWMDLGPSAGLDSNPVQVIPEGSRTILLID